MKRFIALLLWFTLSAAAFAHHTKEHTLQPPAPAPVPAAQPVTDSGIPPLVYALGPFFVLVAIGLVRWGMSRRRQREKARD